MKSMTDLIGIRESVLSRTVIILSLGNVSHKKVSGFCNFTHIPVQRLHREVTSDVQSYKKYFCDFYYFYTNNRFVTFYHLFTNNRFVTFYHLFTAIDLLQFIKFKLSISTLTSISSLALLSYPAPVSGPLVASLVPLQLR